MIDTECGRAPLLDSAQPPTLGIIDASPKAGSLRLLVPPPLPYCTSLASGFTPQFLYPMVALPPSFWYCWAAYTVS